MTIDNIIKLNFAEISHNVKAGTSKFPKTETAITEALRAAIPDKLLEWSVAPGGQHVQDKDAHNYNVGIDRFTKNIERNLGIDLTKKEES